MADKEKAEGHVSLGGNDARLSAHALRLGGNDSLGNTQREGGSKQENRLESFLKRGEDILNTFSQSIKGFEVHAKQMEELSNTVGEIQTELNLKRKEPTASTSGTNDQVPPKKKTRTENVSSEDESDTGDELERVLNDSREDSSNEDEEDMVQDIDSFFDEESTCGDDIKHVALAEAINKSLRCQKTDQEKLNNS
jgi:hypothetical protein